MATYPIKMLKDEEGKPFVPLVNFDAIKELGGESLIETIENKLEPANLIAGSQIELTVEDGNVIISSSAEGAKLINDLTTEISGIGALDAAQGKVLKDSIPEIVNNLNTIDSTKALSAHQGYVLAGRSVPVGGATGQVLKKSANDDYSLEWGDAADPNAIVGDGSIMKIVELSYEEYLELERNSQLQDDTEYHINNWNENERTYLTTYSLEEKIIGSWINGKPLYRKTILLENVTLPVNGDGTIYETILMDLSNIDHIDLSKFHAKVGYEQSTPYITTVMQNTTFDNGDYFYIRGFNNNLLIQTDYFKHIFKACVTIEYTKTTD